MKISGNGNFEIDLSPHELEIVLKELERETFASDSANLLPFPPDVNVKEEGGTTWLRCQQEPGIHWIWSDISARNSLDPTVHIVYEKNNVLYLGGVTVLDYIKNSDAKVMMFKLIEYPEVPNLEEKEEEE